MQKTILFLAVLFCHAFAQAQQTSDDKVLAIRSLFAQINADTTLHKMALDGDVFKDDFSGGKTALTGYYRGDSICKMTLRSGLSYGVVKESYYFCKGVLLFVYETEEDFNNSKLTPVFEGRYYYEGYKVFKTQTTGNKKLGVDDVHHPLELYHNAYYYYGLLMKKLRPKAIVKR